MMKKMFIYSSVVGLAVGIAYWLCNKEKYNNIESNSIDKNVDFRPKYLEEDISHGSTVLEKMQQAKGESLQDIYERHSEAGEIMKDSYRNIMEEFVEDFSSEKAVNEKDKTIKGVIDNKYDSVMEELNLISDELDDLLK